MSQPRQVTGPIYHLLNLAPPSQEEDDVGKTNRVRRDCSRNEIHNIEIEESHVGMQVLQLLNRSMTIWTDGSDYSQLWKETMEVFFPPAPLYDIIAVTQEMVDAKSSTAVCDRHRGDFVTLEQYCARYNLTLKGIILPKKCHYIGALGGSGTAVPTTPPDHVAHTSIAASAVTGDNSDSDREEVARDKRNGIASGSMELDAVPRSMATDSVASGASI